MRGRRKPGRQGNPYRATEASLCSFHRNALQSPDRDRRIVMVHAPLTSLFLVL
jgi:hypothetical protein